MGLIKKRDVKVIHDKKENITTYGLTTFMFHFENKKTISFNDNNIERYGCCTSSAYVKTQTTWTTIKKLCDGKMNEFQVITYKLSSLPSKYRNKKLINEWLNFINEAFPFIEDLQLLKFKDEVSDSEFKTKYNIKTINYSLNNENDRIYIVFKKKFNYNLMRTNPQMSYYNLFVTSLIRYLTNEEYVFMIYDCLRLKKLKSLSNLTNWEIINIARVAHSINNFNKGTSDYYPYLRSYRSPFWNGYYTYVYDNVDSVFNKLLNGNNDQHMYQNDCVKNNTNKVLLINGFYLMYLFQQKQYLKLHTILTNSNYSVSLKAFFNFNETFCNFNRGCVSEDIDQFNNINRTVTKEKIKEYEKQISKIK